MSLYSIPQPPLEFFVLGISRFLRFKGIQFALRRKSVVWPLFSWIYLPSCNV